MGGVEALQQQSPHQLLFIMDLGGTFVFAISGAMVGVQRKLDVFGVLVLSFAASSAGGMLRDMLIGSLPPTAISDWRYLATSVAAGIVIFFWYTPMSRLHRPILLFDAAGLALFSVAGAEKALAHGLDPLMAALLGMVTGVGGGVARDLLVVRMPTILQSDIYAVAALLGAALAVTGTWLDLPLAPTAIVAALACFALRIAAIRFGWRLPVALSPGEQPGDGTQ
jgi:uncharacterized membrane protein YeiH